jgi:hypothetical protein
MNGARKLIAEQVGALFLANLELSFQAEGLRAEVEDLKAKLAAAKDVHVVEKVEGATGEETDALKTS